MSTSDVTSTTSPGNHSIVQSIAIGIAKNASGDYENGYLQQSLSPMAANATGITQRVPERRGARSDIRKKRSGAPVGFSWLSRSSVHLRRNKYSPDKFCNPRSRLS
jgi:hypothetical protein